MTVKEYIGTKVTYDENGAIIWANGTNGNGRWLLDVRGWGAIQNLFATQGDAVKFQDELGTWIAGAINDKLKSEQ